MKINSDLIEYAKYSSLSVLGMIGLSCYILADTYFVANGLGANGLAALNLAIPIYSFMDGVGLMLGVGGANRYSLIKGRGDSDNASFTHALTMAAIFASVFELVGAFSSSVTSWLGADDETFEMCRTYIQTLMIFSPAFLLNQMTICFVRNDGAPQLAMAAMLCGSFSNIALDYVFIFPMNMGIFGAALATCMAPMISLGVMLPFFLSGRNKFHVKRCRISWLMCRNILTDGVPSLITELSSGTVMIIFNTIMLGLCGNDGVAAYSVISNISLVVLSIYNGISQGIQPIVSKYYGGGDFSRAAGILKYSLTTVVLISVVLYAVTALAADPIAAIFNSESNTAMQRMAVEGMRIYFAACPFVGFNIVTSSYLISSDNPKPANTISMMRGFAVIIPLTFLLSAIFGTAGLWCAFPMTELIVAMVGIIVYKKFLLNL